MLSLLAGNSANSKTLKFTSRQTLQLPQGLDCLAYVEFEYVTLWKGKHYIFSPKKVLIQSSEVLEFVALIQILSVYNAKNQKTKYEAKAHIIWL